MTPRPSPSSRRPSDYLRAIVAGAILLACAWLDRDVHVVATQAHIFALIWTGLTYLFEALGVVGGAIAT